MPSRRSGSSPPITQLDWTPFLLIGRGLSALLGTATVVVVYRLASRLFSRGAGLVAAFFLSLCFLHVRHSHFGVMDAPGNVFDQQEAVFLPLAGFHRIHRPGPNLCLYRRSDVVVP